MNSQKLKFEDTRCKHARPYWIWVRLLFWRGYGSWQAAEIQITHWHVVELVEWRTAESEESGSNPRARFYTSRTETSSLSLVVTGQWWMGPTPWTVKWVKKSLLRWSQSTWPLNKNYTKTKKTKTKQTHAHAYGVHFEQRRRDDTSLFVYRGPSITRHRLLSSTLWAPLAPYNLIWCSLCQESTPKPSSYEATGLRMRPLGA